MIRSHSELSGKSLMSLFANHNTRVLIQKQKNAQNCRKKFSGYCKMLGVTLKNMVNDKCTAKIFNIDIEYYIVKGIMTHLGERELLSFKDSNP